jgi:transcriptional regulator with XRE-family HTH domain
MASPKLDNYLRTYRKRSGLSQAEIAYLAGCKSRAQISKFERRNSMPPLHTALALQATLNVPVSDLYAGKYDRITKQVHRRAQHLAVDLGTKRPARGKSLFMYKLRWLVEHCIPHLEKPSSFHG